MSAPSRCPACEHRRGERITTNRANSKRDKSGEDLGTKKAPCGCKCHGPVHLREATP